MKKIKILAGKPNPSTEPQTMALLWDCNRREYKFSLGQDALDLVFQVPPEIRI